jgi:hypothetical protein
MSKVLRTLELPRLLNAKARRGRRCTGLLFLLTTWEEERCQRSRIAWEEEGDADWT